MNSSKVFLRDKTIFLSGRIEETDKYYYVICYNQCQITLLPYFSHLYSCCHLPYLGKQFSCSKPTATEELSITSSAHHILRVLILPPPSLPLFMLKSLSSLFNLNMSLLTMYPKLLCISFFLLYMPKFNISRFFYWNFLLYFFNY